MEFVANRLELIADLLDTSDNEMEPIVDEETQF
jgi:hypothetical protein